MAAPSEKKTRAEREGAGEACSCTPERFRAAFPWHLTCEHDSDRYVLFGRAKSQSQKFPIDRPIVEGKGVGYRHIGRV